MAGYSGTPLWKKLGLTLGLEVVVLGPGAAAIYPAGLGDGAPQVTVGDRIVPGLRFLHLFTTARADLAATLAAAREAMARDGTIWVSWPKKAAGVPTDITEDTIREVCLSMGLVDVKVCAVDATWSGLKLMIRKDLR